EHWNCASIFFSLEEINFITKKNLYFKKITVSNCFSRTVSNCFSLYLYAELQLFQTVSNCFSSSKHFHSVF
ncbi:hypothetical protein L9F63_021450, partial [Diploptera punctata]